MQAGQRVHFVGIGGYGMSGLALVLLKTGFQVTGSDAKESDRVARLRAAGATVHIGHSATYISGADAVIYSTDVPVDNPELVASRNAGIRVMHRSELLATFINRQSGIAVTGTHGKTTTTSMVALILEAAGLDPTVLVGAEVPQFGGNAKVGVGPHVVAEADESDSSFLRYFPAIAVVTNVEPEHLEHYGGDFRQVQAAYRQFVRQIRTDGLLVACADDPEALTIAQQRMSEPGAPKIVLYGLSPAAAWSAVDIRAQAGGTHFTATWGGRSMGPVRLAVPGRHNVLNALGALAVGDSLGVPFATMANILAEFSGAKRRFQLIGEVGGIRVVDDYAHHPTEIRATLQAARDVLGGPPRVGAPRRESGRRIIAVFQPQRYTRTYHLLNEFASAFTAADVLVLTEIYSPPGEKPIPGVSSQVLAERITAQNERPVQLISEPDSILGFLRQEARPGDLVLTMGAGDIWKVAVAFAGGSCSA